MCWAIGLDPSDAIHTGFGRDNAIRLAKDLVSVGFAGRATADVAARARGTVRSDAELAVREMLSEFGIDIPCTDDEPSRYRLLLTAFGYWDLPFESFEGPFYSRLTSCDAQDDLDRLLVLLLHEIDQVSSPADRLAIQARMRAAVRTSLTRK